jgi:nicotinamidase-related amidase
LPGVIERINKLAAKVREQSGTVIFVQHCGREGDDFEPQTPGWAFLPELRRDPGDVVVRKDLNDPFAGTDLQARLKEIAPDRVLITGWATDLCVDATVRSAVTHHHHVVVVTDCHTVSDRPHLDASASFVITIGSGAILSRSGPSGSQARTNCCLDLRN